MRTPNPQRLLELLGLAGFAITQPILDTLGRASGYLLFHGVTRGQLLVAGVLIAVAPAVVLWLASGAGRQTVLHRVALAALAAAAVVVLLPIEWWALGPAAVAAAAVYVLHERVPLFRTWLRVTALGTALFLFNLATSPAARSLGEVEAKLGATRGNGAPVVMVVFDELPLRTLVSSSGGIDPVRFPNFAALAATSTWYRGATTVSSHTWHAVPALLTGRLPHDAGPTAADHPDNLFTLLGEHYDINAIESFERLCPASLCQSTSPEEIGISGLLRAGWRVWQEELGLRESDGTSALVEPVVQGRAGDTGEPKTPEELLAQNHPARFSDFVDAIEGTEQPVLHFLHLLLPHAPWRYLPDGTTYDPGEELGLDGDTWRDEAWPPRLAQHRHRLQAQYVDRLLGELLARLRETGLFDRAVVVVTADHGISFEPGGARRGIEGGPYTDLAYADIAPIPLLVKAPGQQEGRVDDSNVLSVDVLPTIASLLDVPIPWDVDGQQSPERGDEKPFFTSFPNGFGVDPGQRRTLSAATLRTLMVRDLPPPADANDRYRDFRTGPSPELVGRPATEAGPPVEAAIDHPAPYVVGHLEGAIDGDAVAVAFGGVVGGTSPLFELGGRRTFALIVPPDLAARGDPTVHVVTSSGGG
ncbi:MAG: sulfatase-like hydrolase/transferase [Actinomycetota bacterium]